MPVRERQRDRGVRRARTALIQLGSELREARRSLGLRQIDVARAAGVSASWVSRIERGVAPNVGFRMLAVVLAVVGLDLSARAFPGGAPLRDAGQRNVLGRFKALLPTDAPWRTEVPVPIPGDQRAWDAQTRLWGLRVGVEAETAPTDFQALERRMMLKARDSGIERVILVLADSKRNRALLRSEGDRLRASFPLQGRAALEALRSSVDPGCNLLVQV
jgi:HTH-type transcriptional regulator / antitoxin HipB